MLRPLTLTCSAEDAEGLLQQAGAGVRAVRTAALQAISRCEGRSGRRGGGV